MPPGSGWAGRDALAGPGPSPLLYRTFMRIAWLKTGPLHPLDTGGKLRTHGMLRELSRRHEVTYFALATEQQLGDPAITGSEAAGEYSASQRWVPWSEARGRGGRLFRELAANALTTRLPYVIDKYRSPAMASAIAAADASGEFDLLLCDFLTPAVNLFAARGARPATPTALFQHNVEAAIWERLAATKTNPVSRAYYRSQWRRMERYERETCAAFDGVIAVSEDDAGSFRRRYRLGNVLGAVPTGVEVSRFEAFARRDEGRKTVLFLGSMDWMPNIDAVGFLFDEIVPKLPEGSRFEMKIVGRNPPEQLVERAAALPGVEVTGTVPEVEPYLAEAALMIVPLRAGGGTRLKIFEAMAAGVPVLSTTIGAEGLPVQEGRHIAIADTAGDFAAAMAELMAAPERLRAMAREALDLVERNFTWPAVVDVFEGMLAEAVAQRKP